MADTKIIFSYNFVAPLKSCIRKDVVVAVNKKSLNKSSSKNVFFRFYSFTLPHLLVASYRGVFRTLSNIYNQAFFAKILNGFNDTHRERLVFHSVQEWLVGCLRFFSHVYTIN